MLILPCVVILAWSGLPQPPVPTVCLYTQRSPWAAVCLFSRGLVATAMWLWLTVNLTTPFMRHLLAVNQGGHPGAIDGAVSLCEMCLSKPTHSATLSPCLGSLTFVYCPPSALPFHLFLFLPLCVCLSPAHLPSETRQPLNPRSNHRFFRYTFVILKPSGFWKGVLHKHFCRWLGPDMHVIFIAPSCICVYPRQHWMPLSPIYLLRLVSPQVYLSVLYLLLCSVTLHLSTWQVTRSGPPADWLIVSLSYLSILLQSHVKPDQTRLDQLLTWPRAHRVLRGDKEMFQKLEALENFCHLYPTNSPLDMDHP